MSKNEWIAKPDPDGDGSWIVETQAKGERDGLTVWIAYGLTEPVARMIAATPELLAALKAYIGQCCEIGESATWPELKDLRLKMRVAIAKAEGGNAP